jgi:hypothetical protein
LARVSVLILNTSRLEDASWAFFGSWPTISPSSPDKPCEAVFLLSLVPCLIGRILLSNRLKMPCGPPQTLRFMQASWPEEGRLRAFAWSFLPPLHYLSCTSGSRICSRELQAWHIFPYTREPIWAWLPRQPTIVELRPSYTRLTYLHHSGFRLWPSQMFVILRPLFQATSMRHGPCSSNNEPASLATGNPTNRNDMSSGQKRVKRQNATQPIGFSLSMRSQRHLMSSCLA